MAKQKKTNRGPYIKNAHLIGKGGGQIKPVDGSSKPLVAGGGVEVASINSPSTPVQLRLKTTSSWSDWHSVSVHESLGIDEGKFLLLIIFHNIY